jgi:hypothetical protein
MKTNQLQSSGSSLSVQDFSSMQLMVMTKAVTGLHSGKVSLGQTSVKHRIAKSLIQKWVEVLSIKRQDGRNGIANDELRSKVIMAVYHQRMSTEESEKLGQLILSTGYTNNPNLIKESQVTGPAQLWVSDITYIRTRQDFSYLKFYNGRL